MMAVSAVLVITSAAAATWLAWRPVSVLLLRSSSAAPPSKGWVLLADFDAPDSVFGSAVQDLVRSAIDQSDVVGCIPRASIGDALEASGRPRSTRVDGELGCELASRLWLRSVVQGRVTRIGRGYALHRQFMVAESPFHP